MSWNYRIVKITGNVIVGETPRSYCLYSIREVYYDSEQRPSAMTKEEVSPTGPDLVEFCGSALLYAGAFRKPILIFDGDLECFTGQEEDLGNCEIAQDLLSGSSDP